MVSHVYNVDPLLYAIHGDHRDLLDLFLKSGFDRSMLKDSTWLHIAALKNLHYLAKVMLDELKTNVDCIDDYGRTPLYYAVTIPQKETAKLLLERGANVNFQDATKRTPLQTALEFNNKEMVQLLLEHHADIGLLQEFRYLNDNEHSVQHYLVERGLTEMLTLILSEIDVMHVDKHGMTPLHYAAGCNQLEMIELLVSAGAEVDCFDVHKTTPLMRAISKNHLEAYHKLVSLGANVDLARQFRNNNFDGESILHIAAEKNRIEAMKFLVEELKCDVDCIDKNGNTPLHYALQKGCFEVVKYLLGKNANLHFKNNNDQSALQLLEEADFDFKSTET
ncbi:AAEL000447-PA [Aedes aegypti]|uniref:AAEL000447-PA n=1 Tax=Aedes aegypti TaxID=7159 RepID=Q17P63_AEDAE|nr:AAEL000447-PA [Aedes aegypti]